MVLFSHNCGRIKSMKSIAIFVLLLFSSTASAAHVCFSMAAKRINVDPDLLIAIAHVESDFNPRVRNVNKGWQLRHWYYAD